ncbi:MAG: MarR family transcriptional regulator [Clostridia bacterium]|nr:MarR family transcriptional regulator [Clostridia bacterium]
MELERFGRFTLLIDNISKVIHKIKIDTVPYLGIKSVHVFWIYNLYAHPEGLTATEIAANRQVDRSLVSREIAELCSDGYIEYVGGTGKRRNYNTRLVLTEKGRSLARVIWHEAMDIQNKADFGVSDEELELFYSILERLHANLAKIAKDREQEFVEKGEAKIMNTEKSSV